MESQRGDAESAFASASVKLDQTYVTPTETHNPIELQGTTAIWDGSMLTIYEESQGVFNLRSVLAQMFGLPKENVRVVTKFVGSGFGSKLFPWTHCPLAVAAAKQLGKPVKLVLSRKMMFQSVGHRARTQQRVRLGATPDGKLVSLQHDYVYHRSMLDAHHEDCGEATAFHYSVPNLRVKFGRAKRNVGGAADMRGPGAVPGLYATESAMNELADQLKIDPVKLRVLNEPKIDEGLGIPFSSRHFLECLELGAKEFGWSKRNHEVGSMKRDGLTLGWGTAGCAWIATRIGAEANVQLRDDGTVRVACGTQDIGTGTYTILAQLAAHKTGVPLDKVEVALGDDLDGKVGLGDDTRRADPAVQDGDLTEEIARAELGQALPAGSHPGPAVHDRLGQIGLAVDDLDDVEVLGVLEHLQQLPALLRARQVEDRGPHVADVRVDGVAEHEQLDDR